jgi:hypothetical protein
MAMSSHRSTIRTQIKNAPDTGAFRETPYLRRREERFAAFFVVFFAFRLAAIFLF